MRVDIVPWVRYVHIGMTEHYAGDVISEVSGNRPDTLVQPLTAETFFVSHHMPLQVLAFEHQVLPLSENFHQPFRLRAVHVSLVT